LKGLVEALAAVWALVLVLERDLELVLEEDLGLVWEQADVIPLREGSVFKSCFCNSAT
jgi:hypothetical protein